MFSPSRSMRALTLALALVLVPLAAAPLAAQSGDEAALEAELQRIAAETAALRGLPLPEVDDTFRTRQELQASLPDLVAEEYTPEEAEGIARSNIALGLLPEGTDLLQLTLDLLGEQVAGYYDPRTDEMVVLDEDGVLSATEEFTYSHEIVHALQDAELDLDDRMEASEDASGDAALALAALYEGDATAASFDYLLAYPDLAMRAALEPIPPTPLLDAAPAALGVSLLFPYLQGQTFVTSLRANGGWEAVNAAYADPPTSTEQILHPERYADRDEPIDVALPDAGTLGAAWAEVDADVLGELTTAILLADLQPGEGLDLLTGGLVIPEAARNAAAGWGGDRYALWSDGNQDVLVWQSVWDTDPDALAFGRALLAREERRWGGAFIGETPDVLALTTPEIALRLLVRGNEVLLVQAPTLDLADAVVAAGAAATPVATPTVAS